jgi:succinoglycan biosynthesis transport protein ExoP
MNETSDATSIFAPIWRRKWLILAVGIIVAAASYFYYKRQRPTYQATTQVYLGAAAEEQAPGEKASKNRGSALSDQAAVINTIVVEQVRIRLRAEKKGKLARQTKVKAKAPEKSEFITITTEGHTAKGVALVANLTAQTYIRRSQNNHRRAIERALAISRRQLKRIELSALAKAEKPTKKKTGSGSSGSSTTSTGPSASSVIQEANLSSKINQLESSLETVSAQQVKPAKPSTATMLSPKPRKDAIFGFVLGIVLAAIAAYALSRFDRRLRSISAIETVTGLQLLSAMPKVRRPIVAGAGQSPRPSAHLLEPLRRLQAGLRLADESATGASPGSPPRIILFVSPDPGDGKSTIAADLALVQRDAGERVVLVEANFRRPVQNRLLGIEGEGRLGSVLAGQLDVDGGAQRVTSASNAAAAGEVSPGGTATAVQARVGSLFVLGGDRSVANPPALLERQAVGELLRSLAETFDYVLVDVPSPLEVSDAMPLLGIVDRIVVVARAGHTREASAQRLRQLLGGASSAPVAGVVANFVADSELKRYGFSRARAGLWPGGQRSRR